MAPALEFENRLLEAPFFSVCVPQYNRTSFLLKALEVLAEQSFKDYEVCISDGGSTDGGTQKILDFLKSNRFSFVLRTHNAQCHYDKNLRESISLASGQYCLLMGNDDALSGPKTLEMLHQEMARSSDAGVVITNYEDWVSGIKTWRIPKGGFIGSGPQVAADHFRNLAFVSGIVLERRKAQEFATSDWDGSEMYQMYLGCRIIASGYSLLETDLTAISKDVALPGEQVDTYAVRSKAKIKGFAEISLPLAQIGRVVANAIAPYATQPKRSSLYRRIFLQLYMFTYPFWYIEYRRVQSWKYALCLGRGLRPNRICEGVKMTWYDRLSIDFIYFSSLAAGLFMPFMIFRRLRPILFRIAKIIGSGRRKGFRRGKRK